MPVQFKGLYFCMRLSFLLLFVIFAHGCAGIKGSGLGSDASILHERAEERWEALLNKDWEEAYSYELPEYRKTHDLSKYKRRYGSSLQWMHVTIKAVDIKEDQKNADVSGELTYQFTAPPGPGSEGKVQATAPFKERWLKKESEWWFTP